MKYLSHIFNNTLDNISCYSYLTSKTEAPDYNYHRHFVVIGTLRVFNRVKNMSVKSFYDNFNSFNSCFYCLAIV